MNIFARGLKASNGRHVHRRELGAMFDGDLHQIAALLELMYNHLIATSQRGTQPEGRTPALLSRTGRHSNVGGGSM